jgi:hypothetical protein
MDRSTQNSKLKIWNYPIVVSKVGKMSALSIEMPALQISAPQKSGPVSMFIP